MKKIFLFLGISCILGGFVCTAQASGYDEFIANLVNAVQARSDYGDSVEMYAREEVQSGMVDPDILVENYTQSAQIEWDILQKYQEENFSESHEYFELIRSEYMEGLEQQLKAREKYAVDNLEGFWQDWETGYKKRACVIVELTSIPQNGYEWVQFPEETVAQMKMDVGEAADDAELIKEIQSMVNVTADGDPGKGTIVAIKRLQQEHGVEILSGIINADLKNHLLELVNSEAE